ncbi:MAG: peptidase [Nostoc sp.]|uniref:peptidase n=1 Tax=Nostoc sp. TaxID=1180 RepID=UPI002FF98859
MLTGMSTTVVREWSVSIGVPASFLLSIHTGEIFHLEGIYPILNGLGLLGLLVTGLSMSGLFGKKTRQSPKN